MWLLAALLYFLLARIDGVWANVEKIIFLGPSVRDIPLQFPTIGDLWLQYLTPANNSLRTRLSAQFPSKSEAKGEETWFLLSNLTQGQRYEVRICWAATQPTSFWLYSRSFEEVAESPELAASLAAYSQNRQHLLSRNEEIFLAPPFKNQQSSLLFLQIYSAADYFTTNKTLMHNVPPVVVDIILDPYLLNIFPRSLLVPGVSLVGVACAGWVISGFIWTRLSTVAQLNRSKKNR